jgi:phosphoserine phosphatase RsbX
MHFASGPRHNSDRPEMEALVSLPIEWGMAARALPGQPKSGDQQVVESFPGGVLMAALDGIGHGTEAATAAMIAKSILEAHAADPVATLVQQCHEALHAARGVALSIASLDTTRGLLSWLGVGNVMGVLLHPSGTPVPAEKSLLLRAGIVGVQLPALLDADTLRVSEGDTLIFATDGIQSDFARGLAASQSPQKAAESILALHAKTTDDALVLVVRFSSNRPWK